METIRISLSRSGGLGKRVKRVLYAAPNTPDAPAATIRLEVTTPKALSKDNDYRQGAEFEDVDLAPYRLHGHATQALQAFRHSEWGWRIVE